MPLRLSERTRSSRAASTISRFVLRRVSLRALRTKLSSITMFVLPINTVYTKCPECGVWGGKGERRRQEDGGKVKSPHVKPTCGRPKSTLRFIVRATRPVAQPWRAEEAQHLTHRAPATYLMAYPELS